MNDPRTISVDQWVGPSTTPIGSFIDLPEPEYNTSGYHNDQLIYLWGSDNYIRLARVEWLVEYPNGVYTARWVGRIL